MFHSSAFVASRCCNRIISKINYFVDRRPILLVSAQLIWTSNHQSMTKENLTGDKKHRETLRPQIATVVSAVDEEDIVSLSGHDQFQPHTDAFGGKSLFDLLRSMTILRLCRVKLFAENSLWLMQWSKKILGKRFFEKCMKSTMYGQFVAGDTEESVQSTIEQLREHGIRVIVACTSEDDVGGTTKTDIHYDACSSGVIRSIDLAQKTEPNLPMVQTKISGKLPINILVKLSETEVIPQTPLIDALSEFFAGGTQSMIRLTDLLPGEHFTKLECEQLFRGVLRLKTIGEMALDKGVVLLVDAEFTSINPGINILTLAMMKAFNKDKPIIWNTYQCYLKKTMDVIAHHVDLTSRYGVCFGAKLVRGAYMTRERELAKLKGYPDPINDNFQATSLMYHRVADFMLENVQRDRGKYGVIIASHNEDTVRYVTTRMKQLNINKENGGICFGQILGMCDHVTYSLGRLGYNVYKCSTYGTVDDVLPYLYRRAMENQTVLEGTRRDLVFMKLEMRNRLKKALAFS